MLLKSIWVKKGVEPDQIKNFISVQTKSDLYN
jgi:hypothetical protein